VDGKKQKKNKNKTKKNLQTYTLPPHRQLRKSVYFISTTSKYSNKGEHEVTLEVLNGQVIEEGHALFAVLTWPT